MEVYKVQMEEYKINKNIPINDYEEYQLNHFQRFNFRNFDNSFYQYRVPYISALLIINQLK